MASAASVLTLGYGSWGGAADVLLLGYGVGAAVFPPEPQRQDGARLVPLRRRRVVAGRGRVEFPAPLVLGTGRVIAKAVLEEDAMILELLSSGVL